MPLRLANELTKAADEAMCMLSICICNFWLKDYRNGQVMGDLLTHLPSLKNYKCTGQYTYRVGRKDCNKLQKKSYS